MEVSRKRLCPTRTGRVEEPDGQRGACGISHDGSGRAILSKDETPACSPTCPKSAASPQIPSQIPHPGASLTLSPRGQNSPWGFRLDAPTGGATEASRDQP